MNYVDVKVTIWTRAKFNEDADMEKVISTLKEKGFEAVYDDELGFEESNVLYDTEEFIEPVENGSATIEVYAENQLKWSNENFINNDKKSRL